MCVGLRQCAYVTGIYIGHAGSTGALARLVSPAYNYRDSLPEWSKGVDSSSTSASCVGSNPTAVRPAWGMQPHASRSCKHMHTSGCQGVRRCLRGESWLSARNPRHLAQVVQGGGLKFHLRRAAWAQALPARRIFDFQPGTNDSLPEWSKGVDSSSTSASCVGSNPTAVTL